MAQKSLSVFSEDSCKIIIGVLVWYHDWKLWHHPTTITISFHSNQFVIKCFWKTDSGALRINKESISNCSFSTCDMWYYSIFLDNFVIGFEAIEFFLSRLDLIWVWLELVVWIGGAIRLVVIIWKFVLLMIFFIFWWIRFG